MAPVRFDPNEFKNVALALTQGSPSEAQMRTAISRAYYSLFLAASHHFFGNTGPPRKLRKHGVHTATIDRLRQVSTTLAGQLDELRELRVQADYKLLPDPIYEDWSANWQTAQLLDGQIRAGYQKQNMA
ncbi:MAG: hypothetical protein HY671_04655 [Chloroflexi bacterium]|nr:hypothetical protein [Chloroflexota bacterium]